MLDVQHLRKLYAGRPVVDDVSFSVARGECFGLLGPNGAGKTTTLRCCLGLTEPDGGTIRLAGLPVPAEAREARYRVGVVPQFDNLDPDFTVTENLVIYASYFGIPAREARSRAPQLLEYAGLGDRGGAKIDDLSGGMKRRLTLARALVNDPDVLFLGPGRLIKVSGRLIGHQNGGAGRQRPRNGDTLLFAARKLAGIMRHPRTKPHGLEFRRRPRASLGKPRKFKRDRDIFKCRQRRDQVERLKDDADPLPTEPRQSIFTHRRDVLARDAHRARIRPLQPRRRHQEGRFSGAGWPDQPHRHALRNFHRKPAQDMHARGTAPEAEINIAHRNSRRLSHIRHRHGEIGERDIGREHGAEAFSGDSLGLAFGQRDAHLIG